MNIPNHIGKDPNYILGIDSFDSANYIYRSMLWLDYHKRTRTYSSLLYACAEARQGIEYLLFEELVISTGANLSIEDYKKCLKERKSFVKIIKKLSPNYERLQEFTKILVELEPSIPNLIYWNHSLLMRAWGNISDYLHWVGARNLTTENHNWLDSSAIKVEEVVEPLWIKITSGLNGLMHDKDMHPIVQEIWNEFRTKQINAESAKFRLNIYKPLSAYLIRA